MASCGAAFNTYSRTCITAEDVTIATASKNSALLIFFMMSSLCRCCMPIGFRCECVQSLGNRPHYGGQHKFSNNRAIGSKPRGRAVRRAPGRFERASRGLGEPVTWQTFTVAG